MFRRFTAGLLFLAVIGTLAAAPASSGPAVDRLNLRWQTAYDHQFEDGKIRTVNLGGMGPATVVYPETGTHALSGRFVLTVPVLHALGTRLRAGGGAQRIEQSFELPAPLGTVDESFWAWGIESGADLFLRDPEIGYLEGGYAYRYRDLDSDPGQDERSHIGSLAAGYFVTDSRVLPIDLELRFAYERVSSHQAGSSETWPVYDVETLASLYLGDRVRFGIGARYAYADLSPPEDRWTRDVRGLLRLLWLPPMGRSSCLTVGLRASAGELATGDLFGGSDRTVAAVGLEIGLLYPGGSSLVQLVRGRF